VTYEAGGKAAAAGGKTAEDGVVEFEARSGDGLRGGEGERKGRVAAG